MAIPTALFGASSTKEKAIEDAREAQSLVTEECAKLCNDPPPYILTELIGKGSFGRVYRAHGALSEQLVAVKIISIEEGDSSYPGQADTFNDILKEVNTLKLLSNGNEDAKNINCVIDTHLVGQSVWMVTEYCAGGSVATLMKATGGLPERWIIPILREVAVAVHWVHKQGVIHRDIKCANVLITETGGVQLCDFGVAGIIEKRFGFDKRSTITGTLHWMAPELFDNSISYGTEVDIWAFGSMAYEAATGWPPNVERVINIGSFGSYLRQNCPRLESGRYSNNLRDLVACCLNHDQAQRPRIEEVQAHPYIFNTSNSFPTESLAELVITYRNWETQGGNRMSLFSMGGAQGLIYASNVDSVNDGWNFETLNAVDLANNAPGTSTAVNTNGSDVDIPRGEPRKQSKRRQQPNVKALTVPLEQAFDPTIDINYEDNARAFYGGHIQPLSSNTPVSASLGDSDTRESILDLDAALVDDDISRFVDMDTIRPVPRKELEDSKHPSRRRTQDWKFPALTTSNVADSSNDMEVVGLAARKSLSANPDRGSTLSLIDLDASILDEAKHLTCPNNGWSDSESLGSSCGEESFGHEDTLDANSHLPSFQERSQAMTDGVMAKEANALSNKNLKRDPLSLVENLTDQLQRDLDNEMRHPQDRGPSPPSVKVMLGKVSQQDLKEELQRMISSLGEHLEFMSDALTQMSVQRESELV